MQERFRFYEKKFPADAERVKKLRTGERKREEEAFAALVTSVCMIRLGAQNVRREEHVFATCRSGGPFLDELKKFLDDPSRRRGKRCKRGEQITYLRKLVKRIRRELGGDTKALSKACATFMKDCVKGVFGLARRPTALEELKPHRTQSQVNKDREKKIRDAFKLLGYGMETSDDESDDANAEGEAEFGR